MNFFDDPSEIDDRIYSLKGYVNSADWEEVDRQVDMYIRVIKNHLCENHDKIYPADFYNLSICEGLSDIFDTKRHLHGYDVKPFCQCLLAAYRIKEIFLWELSSCNDLDELKRDFQKEVSRLQDNLQMAWKVIDSVDAPIGKQTKANLKKGPCATKSLESLNACIIEILNEKGFDVKPKIIIDKLKTYTDDRPYKFKDYELKYDKKADKLYQVNNENFKERSCGTKKVYEYLKKIRKR